MHTYIQCCVTVLTNSPGSFMTVYSSFGELVVSNKGNECSFVVSTDVIIGRDCTCGRLDVSLVLLNKGRWTNLC